MAEKSEKAVKNHKSFYSCSASVLCAFAEDAGMTEQEAKTAASPFAGGRMGKGGAVMAAAAFTFGGRLSGFTLKSTLLLIYMALLSAVAYSLWSILLKYNEVSRVAVCSFMIPVFGYILSAVFAKETQAFGILSVCALALTVLGVIIVNYDKPLHNDK